MLKFAERKSNKVVGGSRKEKLLESIENILIGKLMQIMARLSITTLYEHDDINVDIKHKIKL